MKLNCFFHYLKEVAAFSLEGVKSETVYIYEYSVKRYGFLADTELILFMVAKANKDGYAKNADIVKGFYTFGSALQYAQEKYKVLDKFVKAGDLI